MLCLFSSLPVVRFLFLFLDLILSSGNESGSGTAGRGASASRVGQLWNVAVYTMSRVILVSGPRRVLSSH